jgi:hypothetical protein
MNVKTVYVGNKRFQVAEGSYATCFWVFLIIALMASPVGATSSWCATPKDTPDGFINLRSGPGVTHSIVARVTSTDVLLIDTGQCRDEFGPMHCDKSGTWVFVESVYSVKRENRTQHGWINSHFIRQIACTDE